MDFLNDPEKVEALLNEINGQNDYARRSGIRITHIDPTKAEGIVEITKNVYNPLEMAHGGFLYTFADTVAGVAAWALTGRSYVTQGSNISFLRPVKEGMVRAVAKPIKMGRQICIYSVEIFDESDAMAFYATFTFFQKDRK